MAFIAGSTKYPLFTAGGPNEQPITVRPEVRKGPDEIPGSFLILFGTGRYFGVDDGFVPPNPPIQSFYGILDKMDGNRIMETDRSSLQQQEIVAETSAFDYDVRVISDNSVEYHAGKKGWYLDLVSPVSGRQGERVIDSPILVGDNLVFTTLIPSQSTCGFGGQGWLIEINPVTGARIDETIFDLNGNGLFDESEKVEIADGDDADDQADRAAVSGKKSRDGIITTPGVIKAGERDFKLTSTSSGTIETTVEKHSGPRLGRNSWKQIR